MRELGKGNVMSGWALVILVLALVLGGVGLFVEALRWLLIVGAVLFLIAIFTGRRTVV